MLVMVKTLGFAKIVGGDPNLSTKSHPRLYSICFDKNMLVASIFDKGFDRVNFRRLFRGTL